MSAMDRLSVVKDETTSYYPEIYQIILHGVLQHCSTQSLPEYENSILAWILDEENAESQFEKRHPDAFWAVKTLVRVFRDKVISTIPNNAVFPENKRNNIIETVQWEIQIAFVRHLMNFTNWLDPDFVMYLSAEKYEHLDARNMTLAIVPSSLCIPPSLRFSSHNKLSLDLTNVHAVRKQLQLAKGGTLAICKDGHSGGFYTVGLLPKTDSPSSQTNDNAYKYFRYVFRGYMQWDFCVPTADGREACRLRYQQGRYKLPNVNLDYEIEELVHRVFKGPTKVKSIINAVDKGNGTALIISSAPTIQAECSRLIKKFSKGILFQKPIDLSSLSECELRDQLGRLTGIDGTVFVDDQGLCHSCGMILDGITKTPGKQGRGSRFNSTKTYVEYIFSRYRQTPVIGVVKSEDGMLDILVGKLVDKNV